MPLETIVLTLHVLTAAVAVGAVAVTDFLHLKGLKNHRLEVRLLGVYPYLTQIITLALVGLIVTGGGMLYFRPYLFASAFFQLKMILFLTVTMNGLVLAKRISPLLEHVVKHNHATKRYLLESSLFGSLSVVTWMGIFVLSLTKTSGYSVSQFLFVYSLVFLGVFTVSYVVQRKSFPSA